MLAIPPHRCARRGPLSYSTPDFACSHVPMCLSRRRFLAHLLSEMHLPSKRRLHICASNRTSASPNGRTNVCLFGSLLHLMRPCLSAPYAPSMPSPARCLFATFSLSSIPGHTRTIPRQANNPIHRLYYQPGVFPDADRALSGSNMGNQSSSNRTSGNGRTNLCLFGPLLHIARPCLRLTATSHADACEHLSLRARRFVPIASC